VAMIPHERSLVKRLQGKPFALLGINIDTKETLRKLIKGKGITWRNWRDYDPDDPVGGPITRRWNIYALPTLYLLDPKGVIRHKWLGDPGTKVLDEAVEALVKETEGRGERKSSK
jgi:peroxiredoxin